MKCAKCDTETTAGNIYRFYYGRRGATDFPNPKLQVTRFAIAGSEDTFLCDECVNQQIERRARIMAGAVFGLIFGLALVRLALGPPAPGSELETVIGFPMALIAGVVIYLGIRRWKKSKMREFVGDGLLIKMRKPELRNAGFDSFFTRDAFQRLT